MCCHIKMVWEVADHGIGQTTIWIALPLQNHCSVSDSLLSILTHLRAMVNVWEMAGRSAPDTGSVLLRWWTIGAITPAGSSLSLIVYGHLWSLCRVVESADGSLEKGWGLVGNTSKHMVSRQWILSTATDYYMPP
ncbi:hypothetical protein F5I97DRAFT_1832427 [Phlebopus sp. FC_14]|nr:hypothetical protein F5I97DRAFT_1832427 [Phlebopus sp. FC_14]